MSKKNYFLLYCFVMNIDLHLKKTINLKIALIVKNYFYYTNVVLYQLFYKLHTIKKKLSIF